MEPGRDEATPTNTPGSVEDLAYDLLTFEEFGAELETTFTGVPHLAASPLESGDWGNAPTIEIPQGDADVEMDDWSGEADCSATARIAYDDERFYVRVVVTDDTHQTAGTLWRGDSMQVGFAPTGEYGPGYTIAHRDDEAVVRINNGRTQRRGAEAVTAQTERSGTEVTYEVAFPWETIADRTDPPSDGSMPFAFIVNDNDGSGRKGWIQWTPVIGDNQQISNMAVLGLQPNDRDWNAWFSGPTETTVGTETQTVLYVPNYGEATAELAVDLPDVNVENGALELPAGRVARVPVTVVPEEGGEQVVEATVRERGGDASTSVSWTVESQDRDAILERFDDVEAEMSSLTSLYDRAESAGHSLEYERVNRTVLESFLEWGRSDVEHDEFDRARYVANQLERILEETKTSLQAYLDGDAEPRGAPRYRASQPEVDGTSLMAKAELPDGSTERRRVFFNGYGGFDQNRDTIPEFQDYGANVVHQGLSPAGILQETGGDEAVWETKANNDADVTFTRDDAEAHSGQRSMRIHNETPKTPDTFGTMSQEISVEPDATYQLSLWVKGTDVSQSVVVVDWDERQPIPGGSYEWQELTLEVTTDTGQSTMEVRINCSDVTEALWIDDVRLTKAGSDDNLLENPGFESQSNDEDGKGYEVNQSAVDAFTTMLETAAENDVAVSALLKPHQYPEWAYERWPDLKAEPTGHFHDHVIDHPKARELDEAYLGAVVPAIKDYDSLHSICLANEPGYRSRGDQWTRDHWPAFLRERYGDVASLNEAYGSDFDSFDAVDPGPNNLQEHPRTYDWATFNNERYAEYFRWRADLIEEMAPDVPLHNKIMGHGLENRRSLIDMGIDPERIATSTDINGNDDHNWPDQGPDGYLGYLAFYDLQRSLETAPVFNSENHLIRNEHAHYEPMIADHVRTNIWMGALHGCTASSMWLWKRTYDLEQSPGSAGSIAHRPDAVAKFGHTTLDMNRLAAEVTAFQTADADVAILYSVVAHVFAEDYKSTLHEAYGGLSFAGQKVDFASEDQVQNGVLSNYDAVVVPHAPNVQAGTLEGLASFVEDGGTAIVVGEDSLAADERAQDLPTAQRQTVLDAADVVPVDADRETIRSAVREPFDPAVRVVNADSGELIEGVEFRTVEHDGRLLVAVANYTNDSFTVRIERDGAGVSSADELLSASESSLPATIERRTPRLFAIDG